MNLKLEYFAENWIIWVIDLGVRIQFIIIGQPNFKWSLKNLECMDSNIKVVYLQMYTTKLCLIIEELKIILFTFRLHIYKSHTENSQYTCQSCAQDFYDLKKFVLHQIKLHAERSGDQIFCLACRRPYTKSHSLQVHMIRKSGIIFSQRWKLLV